MCDLTGPVGPSQPTLSHHLKFLVDAGLLTRERRGSCSFCSVVEARLGALGNQPLTAPSRVTTSRRGRWIDYSLAPDALDRMAAALPGAGPARLSAGGATGQA